MSVQRPVYRCECRRLAIVTATESPWEFSWTCEACKRSGLISWFHGSPPPTFAPETQRELFPCS